MNIKTFPWLPRVTLLTFIVTICVITLSISSLQAETQGGSQTGDPWKMLIIVYRETDVDYVDIDGTTKHLTATMPPTDEAAMIQAFQNLPHQGNVNGYSDQTAELEAHIVYSSRPITSVTEVGGPYSYWPSPEDTRPELDQFAPTGMYDSVIIFWQASDPNGSQSIPSNGWGWGYWPGENGANGMTYASVFNLSWVWPNNSCEGEVFLHEWLHGVTGFYMSQGFTFPVEDLHGAEEAGYVQENGCWETWLRDYMRGLVIEDGENTALVPEAWQSGSITTTNIQGWRAEYYNNETLADLPVVVRDDASIDFEWSDAFPHPLVQPDHFSARWTRTLNFPADDYTFTVLQDDGARLWIDGVLILDEWHYGRAQYTVEQTLSAGLHSIRLETYEIDGWARAGLSWTPDTNTGPDPIASIVFPNDNDWLHPNAVTISVNVSDDQDEVDRVEFFWHSSDWDGSDWIWLGVDNDGTDGWTYDFDTSSLPEQVGGAFYVWAFDLGGNLGTAAVWDLGIDRTATSAFISLNGDNIDLNWSGGAASSSYCYEVHRSVAPYFVSNAETSMVTLPAGTMLFQDVSGGAGDVGLNYFYRVAASICGGNVVNESQTVGEFDFSIQPGL